MSTAKGLPRVKEAIEILKMKKFNVKVNTYIDLGCNDGSIAIEIAKTVNARTAYCIDIDDEALEKAKEKGLITRKADLSIDKIPLGNESADLVTAFEVIEHLINPDNMLKESNRILKHGGALLITTPNLASWVNRVVLLLGYQPYNVEVSTEIVAGVPWRARTFAKPSGHIRPYTLRALKELLEYHGFKIMNVKGAPGVEPKELHIIDHIFSKNHENNSRSPLYTPAIGDVEDVVKHIAEHMAAQGHEVYVITYNRLMKEGTGERYTI